MDFQDFHLESGTSQGQNLAPTALFVPTSLDSGTVGVSPAEKSSNLLAPPSIPNSLSGSKRLPKMLERQMEGYPTHHDWLWPGTSILGITRTP